MENMFYDTVMVRKNHWREDAAKLVEGTNATAAFYKEQKYGVLIRIGAPSQDELQAIRNKTISSVEA